MTLAKPLRSHDPTHRHTTVTLWPIYGWLAVTCISIAITANTVAILYSLVFE